ncbi:MAG: hypothetical protein KDA89_17030 [Planctomycetaceae bacterium]|nr:hypothetical protein [Planctomycetaceae bacterium]
MTPVPSLARHPISVTEAQVYVTRTAARMRIQLFAEDLFLFHGLEPDARDILSPEQLRSGLQQHRQFLLDKVKLRDAKGEAFPGRVTDLQPFEIPDEGIAVDELMLHTAVYELEFPFSEPPEFLTVQQDISDENFIFPSEMKMVLHQAGTDLTYTESLKPGTAHTIRFDWNQPPLPDDATDADWRQWLEKQRQATLGITSYSSVYSFIYFEPAEVRHEVLIPLAALKTILPMQHTDPAFIEVEEQEAVRNLIREWLVDANPVTINDTAVKPEFTRIDFYGLDLKDFAQQAEQRRVSLANGRVGIIMTYRYADEAIRRAVVTWDTFHSSIRKVHSVIISGNDEMRKFEFSRFNEAADNQVEWAADLQDLPKEPEEVAAVVPGRPVLTIPVLSCVLLTISVVLLSKCGKNQRTAVTVSAILAVLTLPAAQWQVPHPWKPLPEISDADGIFRKLHQGAYGALAFGTEEQIYDALETAVDGSLLESLYLQLHESLRIREQGGAVARVRSVDYNDGRVISRESTPIEWPGFRYRSTWTVAGTVEHWGHIHERQNRFTALFDVRPEKGAWKITSMQVEDQENVSSRTSLRKF